MRALQAAGCLPGQHAPGLGRHPPARHAVNPFEILFGLGAALDQFDHGAIGDLAFKVDPAYGFAAVSFYEDRRARASSGSCDGVEFMVDRADQIAKMVHAFAPLA